MKPRDVVYCTAPWEHQPVRDAHPLGEEPHCPICGARLSRYRGACEVICAPCQLATHREPTPNPCACGCGQGCWPDPKGRGGKYVTGHNKRKRAA